MRRLGAVLAALLVLVGVHACQVPSGGSRRPALLRSSRPLLLALRGGSDADAAGSSDDSSSSQGSSPAPVAADADVLQLPEKEREGEEIAAAATSPFAACFAGVRKLLQMVLSLLSPNYEYSKQGSDLLGDVSQQCGFDPEDESWRTQRKKIHDIELQAGPRKRVLRDLRRLKGETDIGVEVEDCEVLTDWVIKLVGAKGTVYEDEIYRLRVRFHADYPSQPPEIVFMRPAPVHEHIYSDGKICLNILYNDWEPTLDVKAVCLSLRSMLSSAKRKKRPPDNDSTVVMSQGQKTRNMQWEFHDDKC